MSGVCYLYEVVDNPEHTLNLRSCFVFHRLVHLAETQRFEGIFLTLGFVNGAFDQRNFYFTHCSLLVIGYRLLVIGDQQLITSNRF